MKEVRVEQRGTIRENRTSVLIDTSGYSKNIKLVEGEGKRENGSWLIITLLRVENDKIFKKWDTLYYIKVGISCKNKIFRKKCTNPFK